MLRSGTSEDVSIQVGLRTIPYDGLMSLKLRLKVLTTGRKLKFYREAFNYDESGRKSLTQKLIPK